MMEINSFDQGYLTLAARLAKEDLDRSHPEYSTATPMLVWHCKALKNRKYVFGTPVARIIHEVTYNGEKDEWYVDRYVKEENSIVLPKVPDRPINEKPNFASGCHTAKGTLTQDIR